MRARGPGVTVLDVRDILILDTATSVGARLRLEEFAATRLVYQMDKTCESRVRPGDDYYISNEYKTKVLQAMSAEQLVDIVMTNPTVTILPSGRDTYFTASYSFQPLSNVVFTRDQQVTTRKVRRAARTGWGARPAVVQRNHSLAGLSWGACVGERRSPPTARRASFWRTCPLRSGATKPS